MKYKNIIRTAQILFLVVIPKKMLHASSSSESIYDGKEFLSQNQCETIKKSTIPFYIVSQDLFSDSAQIYKGSIVSLTSVSSIDDYEKDFKILKNPRKDARAAVGTHKLGLNFVDVATNWNINILQTKQTPISLTNKTLRLETSQDKVVYKRCFINGNTTDLPQFIIYNGSTIEGKIAFQPSASDFINVYSVSRIGSPQGTTYQPPTVEAQSTEVLALEADKTPTPPVTSPQQKVICTQSAPLRIYDESLNTIIYKAPKYLPVKVFQDWNGGPADKTVKGHAIVKVQLTTGSGKEINGWAASTYIKPAQECSGMPLMYGGKDGEEVIPGSTVVVESPANCCRFPTLKPPSAAYTNGSGRRYFGARRRNGQRAHAAADLLRPEGEKVLSIDGGKVLRKYHFYAGSHAIEVKHDNGMVARYGEVDKREVAGSESGTRIIKGQHIGNVSHLKMLHFEIYTDTVRGPLTIEGSGKYWRRSDLIDPTPLLLKWQDMTF